MKFDQNSGSISLCGKRLKKFLLNLTFFSLIFIIIHFFHSVPLIQIVYPYKPWLLYRLPCHNHFKDFLKLNSDRLFSLIYIYICFANCKINIQLMVVGKINEWNEMIQRQNLRFLAIYMHFLCGWYKLRMQYILI